MNIGWIQANAISYLKIFPVNLSRNFNKGTGFQFVVDTECVDLDLQYSSNSTHTEVWACHITSDRITCTKSKMLRVLSGEHKSTPLLHLFELTELTLQHGKAAAASAAVFGLLTGQLHLLQDKGLCYFSFCEGGFLWPTRTVSFKPYTPKLVHHQPTCTVT